MLLERIYQRDLAQASYLIGCQAAGVALVVDPNRSIEQYRAAAQRAGLRIIAVTETHIHADFVSGACELAAQTGAQLYLSGAGPAEWQYTYADAAGARLLCDGDRIMIGKIQIDVLHTPGHTPEHLAFLVTDTAAADAPIGLLSGDCMFVGDVGRPDLLERAAGAHNTMKASAQQLYSSLQRLAGLPEFVQLWPGHGAGSACGKALGAVPQSTIGYERRFGWAFRTPDQASFIEKVLSGQPEPPPYFAEMKRVNQHGPQNRPGLPAQRGLPELECALADQAILIDTRPANTVANGHIRGAFGLPCGAMLTNWGGWLLPYDRPLGLIVEQHLLEKVYEQLLLIGLDRITGYWTPDVLVEWRAAGRALAAFERSPAAMVRKRIEQADVQVIDVRKPDEYAAGHIPGSHNLPLAQLPSLLESLPPGGPVVVHCQHGSRSAIAAGLLAAHGWSGIIDMCDGYAGYIQE